MLGAIIGDIVGSTREHHNVKTEDFELLPVGSRFTDDTVMTLAVAEWLMLDPEHTENGLIDCMQHWGRKYYNAGYGGRFKKWLIAHNPRPYNSWGNGSAMRVSPIGLYAKSLDEALRLAAISASVSHNHPEGIKGAQAVAACVYFKKNLASGTDEEMVAFVSDEIGYNLDIDLEKMRAQYAFDVTCQGSVPIAIRAYLDRSGCSAEQALRLAISMGGDSDTIGAITASIADAERYHSYGAGLDGPLVASCRTLLPADLLTINDDFEKLISALHNNK